MFQDKDTGDALFQLLMIKKVNLQLIPKDQLPVKLPEKIDLKSKETLLIKARMEKNNYKK